MSTTVTIHLMSVARALLCALEAEIAAHHETRSRLDLVPAGPEPLTSPPPVVAMTPPPAPVAIPPGPEPLPARWGHRVSPAPVEAPSAPQEPAQLPPAPAIVHPITEPPQDGPGGSAAGVALLPDPGPTVAMRRPVVLSAATVEGAESCRHWPGYASQARTLDTVIEDMVTRIREAEGAIRRRDLAALREIAERRPTQARPGLLCRVQWAIEALERPHELGTVSTPPELPGPELEHQDSPETTAQPLQELSIDEMLAEAGMSAADDDEAPL